MAVPSAVGDAKNSVRDNYYFHAKYIDTQIILLLKATTQNVKI